MDVYVTITYVFNEKTIQKMLETLNCKEEYNKMKKQEYKDNLWDLLKNLQPDDYKEFCLYSCKDIEMEE